MFGSPNLYTFVVQTNSMPRFLSFRIPLILLLLISFLYSCSKLFPGAPADHETLEKPVDGLTPEQLTLFQQGDEAFSEVFTRETGLGPIYVASSCAGCHSGDNRGHPFTALTRFGQSDTNGNSFLHAGGPQLQPNYILGYTGENLPAGASSSKFLAPLVAGMGFLEFVTEQSILEREDPNDSDGDGVSGRAHWNTLPDFISPNPGAVTQQGRYLCRFGRKAGTYSLFQQTTQAYNQDMGITTSFMSTNPFNPLQGTQVSPTSNPDITDDALNATTFYMQTVHVPVRKQTNDPAVLRGEHVFKQIACNACHTESMQTGNSPIDALRFKTFYPYTDLLLHDMGSELNDGYTEGFAQPEEWRTPPLWGLGQAPLAQGGRYFLLHDGRAKSIEEAIQFHGGEGSGSRTRYNQLSANEKDDLLAFLKSL